MFCIPAWHKSLTNMKVHEPFDVYMGESILSRSCACEARVRGERKRLIPVISIVPLPSSHVSAGRVRHYSALDGAFSNVRSTIRRREIAVRSHIDCIISRTGQLDTD